VLWYLVGYQSLCLSLIVTIVVVVICFRCVDNAMSDNGEHSQPVMVPTYIELFNLVQQLREQVELANARQITSQVEQSALQNTTSVTKSEVAEFRVVPDLNKTISQFTGRESSHEAKNWLDSMNGTASANG